jgi:hypothetical protein
MKLKLVNKKSLFTVAALTSEELAPWQITSMPISL